MQKKMMPACLAIMALAAVPSLASANPILTKPTGTVMATGSAIKARNVGLLVFTTSVGNLNCSTAILEETLTGNTTATGAKIEITSARFGGTGPIQTELAEPECTGDDIFGLNATFTPTLNVPWCLTAPASTDVFTVIGGPCGAPRAIKFALDVTGIGTCSYSRTAAANGTLVTDGSGANENTIAISEQAWVRNEGSFGCPSEGKLDTRFSLTSGGGAVFISS